MSIQKTTSISEITVSASGVVYYEEVTTITEDGAELARKHHRVVLNPGQDLTGHPAGVIAICTTAWTPEVVAAYAASSEPSRVPQE